MILDLENLGIRVGRIAIGYRLRRHGRCWDGFGLSRCLDLSRSLRDDFRRLGHKFDLQRGAYLVNERFLLRILRCHKLPPFWVLKKLVNQCLATRV